jgi:hypothetical protein
MNLILGSLSFDISVSLVGKGGGACLAFKTFHRRFNGVIFTISKINVCLGSTVIVIS